MYHYKTHIAGTEVTYAFRHPDTAACFGEWVRACGPLAEPVAVPEEAIRDWQKKWGLPDDNWTEFDLSVFYTSDILLKSGFCVFHAAAFLMDGKAYLLTAASGTGKSTQLHHLLSLYPEEISVMNGDKPVLGAGADGVVTAYPSPWKGKEQWGDDSITAPLGGIVILEQGETNVIRKADIWGAVPFLMSRFLHTAGSRETILAAAALEERMLQAVPVLTFTNTGKMEGTKVLFDALTEEEEESDALSIS